MKKLGEIMSFNLVELLKLPNKILFPISLASGSILFLPDKILEKMYLMSFRDKWGFIIGICFLISTSILLISILLSLWNIINSKIKDRKFKKNTSKAVRMLDDYKKTIVYGLYLQANNTSILPINDGAVIFLENMFFIQKATTQYAQYDLTNPVFPYFLQPWVKEKLNEDEELKASYKVSYMKMKSHLRDYEMMY